jgi:putative SOS response-associated peptidase YedK
VATEVFTLRVDPGDYDRWLSSEVPPIDLLRPYPAKKMTAHEIGQQINKRGYDAPDIVDSISLQDDGPGRA